MAPKTLKTGDTAPEFTLPDHAGTLTSLDDMRGSWVVLYFYPKDNTSGCTAEAVDFTALAGKFKKLGAIVIGISPDRRKPCPLSTSTGSGSSCSVIREKP